MSETKLARVGLGADDRVVVKIGSALLASGPGGLDRQAIAGWARQLAALRAGGVRPLVVSSGAVAAGMHRLGWTERPEVLHRLQAAAAVGQMGLAETWEQSLRAQGMTTAQVLLTHADLADRRRYLNARTTLRTLLGHGIVPVVNENDVVANDEIRFGDNDRLAGLVANLVEARLLIVLTDQPGLRTEDPRYNPSAELIDMARVDDPALDGMVSARGGVLGRGGMLTKLQAARLAARSGTHTVIAHGGEADVLARIARGADEGRGVGTWLQAGEEPMVARKRWLAGSLRVSGTVVIDAGAAEVLRRDGRSLLPVGVTDVRGDFRAGDLVACVDPAGREVARGLCSYSADEARRIVGLPSGRIAEVLGYPGEAELIHRDNLVVL